MVCQSTSDAPPLPDSSVMNRPSPSEAPRKGVATCNTAAREDSYLIIQLWRERNREVRACAQTSRVP